MRKGCVKGGYLFYLNNQKDKKIPSNKTGGKKKRK